VPKGILIDESAAIFREAGISFQFAELPLKRIVNDLEANQEPICSPGWYKLPERERIGRFSLPILRDRPRVVLAAAQAAPAVRAHATLQSLTQDPQLTMAVIDGVSMGAELDAMIARMPHKPVVATVTALHLPKMVIAGRADYMLIDQADFDYLNSKSEIGDNGLELIRFADMPPGLPRYLWCSRAVSPALVERLNIAIHKLGFDS